MSINDTKIINGDIKDNLFEICILLIMFKAIIIRKKHMERKSVFFVKGITKKSKNSIFSKEK
jgi:hypothetical protein